MKYSATATAILMFLSLPAIGAEISQSVPQEELDFKTENNMSVAYDKKGNLYSGIVIKNDKQGRTTSYTYQKGIRSGVAISRYEDGSIDIETTYKQNRKNGSEILFYINGNPHYKRTYKNDVLHGDEFVFYDSGKPQKKSHYENGILEGEVNYYDESGNLNRIENYKNGIKNGIERIIENNSLKQENMYVNGKLEGVIKNYNDKYLVEEINYKNGERNGITRQYSANGNIIEIPYVKNKKNGTGYAYYPDKKIANSAEYLNDEKNGISKRFYQNGIVQLYQNYKNNKLEGVEQKFDSQGRLESVSYYVNGVELAVVNIESNSTLKDLYAAIQKEQIGKYLTHKYNWYPVLWLAISTGNAKVLDELKKNMAMYNVKIADTSSYISASKSKYNQYNRQLFFGMTPLEYAVNLSASTDILQQFSAKENIEEVSPRGDTPLSDAVRLNNLEMVRFLLLHNADVKKKYADNNTILLYAVKEKVRPEIISALIDAGADTKAEDAQKNTALKIAISDKNEPIIEILLKSGKESPQQLSEMLFEAIEQKTDKDIIQMLIDAGATPNYKNKNGELLTIKALQNNQKDVVMQLLQKGADVNILDANGESMATWILVNKTDEEIFQKVYSYPLNYQDSSNKYKKSLWQLLAQYNQKDLLKKAISQIGGFLQKDSQGEIPLMYLMQLNNNELLDLAYAETTVEEFEKNSPLIWKIIKTGDITDFKRLVDKGINPEIKNENGDTILMYLIRNKYALEYIETLEKLSPNINTTDSNNEPALLLAIKNNDVPLVKNLLEHGADVKFLQNGENLLMLVTGEQKEITNLLLEHNADIKYINQNQKTVLMSAIEKLNDTLVEYILSQKIEEKFQDADGNTEIMYIAEALTYNQDKPDAEKMAKITKILKMMTEAGNDINTRNSNGETLLIRLAKNKAPMYENVITLLIELGAEEDLKDQYGKTYSDYM